MIGLLAATMPPQYEGHLQAHTPPVIGAAIALTFIAAAICALINRFGRRR